MFPIVKKQAEINAFKEVAIPSNKKLFYQFGVMNVRESSGDSSEPIDVTAGMSKLDDMRAAQRLDDYQQYKDSLPVPEDTD